MADTTTLCLLLLAVIIPFGCAARMEMKEDARYKAETGTTRDWRHE